MRDTIVFGGHTTPPQFKNDTKRYIEQLKQGESGPSGTDGPLFSEIDGSFVDKMRKVPSKARAKIFNELNEAREKRDEMSEEDWYNSAGRHRENDYVRFQADPRYQSWLRDKEGVPLDFPDAATRYSNHDYNTRKQTAWAQLAKYNDQVPAPVSPPTTPPSTRVRDLAVTPADERRENDLKDKEIDDYMRQMSL